MTSSPSGFTTHPTIDCSDLDIQDRLIDTAGWPRVIGLSAKKRHGKDTFGAQLQALGYTRVAFADALYEEVAQAYGVSVARLQDPTTKEMPMAVLGGASPRVCLQNHGMRRRAADPLYWIRRVEALLRDPTRRFVVTDVRLPDEAEMVTRYGIMVRITRPGLPVVLDAHISETALDSYPFQHRLTNREGDPAGLLRDWIALMREQATNKGENNERYARHD